MRNTFATIVLAWMVGTVHSIGTTLTYTDNLILRLDAQHVTPGGSGIAAWNNQVAMPGASDHFYQTVDSRRPVIATGALGGLPALDFDGTDDFFNNSTDPAWDWDYDTNPADAARWTVFVVNQPDTSVNNRFLMRSGYDDYKEDAGTTGAQDQLWGLWHDDNAYSVHTRSTSGSFIEARWNGAVDLDWHIFAGLYNIGTVDPSVVMYRDSAVVASQVSDHTRQMAGHRRTNIGANSGSSTAPTEYFDGRIAEVLVYKEALTAWQLAEVNGYLAAKYGFADDIVSNLIIHCTMDDDRVSRNAVHAPPAFNTDDADWTVEDWTSPADNGTATAVNTTGRVLSSVPGVVGEAIRFSDDVGGDRHVTFGTAPTLVPGTDSFSVSVWFKPSGMGGVQFIASHGNQGSADNGWSIWLDNTAGKLQFRCNSGGINNNANKGGVNYTGLVDGEWYHAVLVIDRGANQLKGYLNGTAVGANADATWGDTFSADPIGSGGKILLLGNRNDLAAEMKGDVDDFAIWRRALTPNEIAAIYALGKDGKSFIAIPRTGTLFIIR